MKNLIRIDGLNKCYGLQVLFEDASATFSDDQKIGVIGRNGAGKSTLCRVITGDEEPDSGTIWKSDDLRLGYLEQHDPYTEDETVIGFLTRYTGHEDWFCAKTAWKFEITNAMLGLTIGSLPGGFRTRVKLAAMLVKEPNFLILDEPSNYLDLKTLILLENFLQDGKGGYLIVSHDREFMKRTCEHTLEIENGRMIFYMDAVHEYLVFKEEQKLRVEQVNKTLEAKQKHLEVFIDRFKATASKATQARSKMKQLERLQAQTIETDHALAQVNIRLPQVEKKAGLALRVADLSIGYPGKKVASHITLDVDRGHRVAILGDNGQGKTTFMRTLAGELSALGGSFKWGHGLDFGYYAQHVFVGLDESLDVRSTLSSVAPTDVPEQQILDLAGCFLFRGDDVKKKIGVLSGGERSRVCLASLLLARKPLLLLDEPTNHLDFETVEALGHALKEYNGTIFFICHDRTFVNLVATEVLEVKDGSIIRYPGTYEEYVYSLERRVIEEFAEPEESASQKGKPSGEKEDGKPRSRYEERKVLTSDRRKFYSALDKSESSQTKLKKEIDTLQQKLESEPSSWTNELSERYAQAKKELETEEENWLEIHEKAEETDKKINELG